MRMVSHQDEFSDVEPSEPEVRPSTLSADLASIRARFEGKSLTVGDLQAELGGRGIATLLLLLALPFCFLPLPVLSTPFGVAVLLTGVSIAIGRKPWLPQLIRKRTISPARLAKVLASGMKFARIMEKIVRPRMQFLHRWPGMINLIGVGIAAGGLLLLLPLPIPFSNVIPAWTVVFLSAGMMERDGLLVLLGHLSTVATWGLIALVWVLGWKGVQSLFDLL